MDTLEDLRAAMGVIMLNGAIDDDGRRYTARFTGVLVGSNYAVDELYLTDDGRLLLYTANDKVQVAYDCRRHDREEALAALRPLGLYEEACEALNALEPIVDA